MLSTCVLQVIIKHLRESGVFSSVIAEAWAKKNNASSRHEGFWESYSRRFGRMFESHATSGKVINVEKLKSGVVAPESSAPMVYKETAL